MKLTEIHLTNFRNYSSVKVKFDQGLVLVFGANASGKTNFLESIYYLSRLKSFRSPDFAIVKFNEDYLGIQALAQNKLEVIVQTNPSLTRVFKLDGKKIKKVLWQPFNVVLFVPDDLNLFTLGPSFRRKYLNETISQKNSAYAADLASLDHVLKQKAALLGQILKGEANKHQLIFWNEQLASLSIRICLARVGYLDFLRGKIVDVYKNLTDFSSEFELRYKSFEAANTDQLLAKLQDSQEAEIRSGQNLVGPHRDDFEIYRDGRLNIYNSSRGELRSQILALKLLQAGFLSEENKKPVILLDDVFSELDEIRRAKLLETLTEYQIFITSTEEHHLPKLSGDVQILKVENNQIVS